jgi:hypothetical protein
VVSSGRRHGTMMSLARCVVFSGSGTAGVYSAGIALLSGPALTFVGAPHLAVRDSGACADRADTRACNACKRGGEGYMNTLEQ